MRYLGIDYGKKRTGLSISDEGGSIAFPHKTIPGSEKLITALKETIEKEKIGKIIIGLPIPFGGGESKQLLEVKKFASLLKKEINLPIEFENEVLTTKMAVRNGISAENLDKASAAIILQSYLDKERGQNLPSK
ncbi:MAG: Holliday junction resolvase RuvX [bacterium]|nr:Holliday junction resolvase RuvX [bacterium]